MGDRWYMQQKNAPKKGEKPKPKRKLKVDYIADVLKALEVNGVPTNEIPGLDKLTIATLESLISSITASMDAMYNYGYDKGLEASNE